MLGLGTSELVVILVIVMVLFGAAKIPQLGKGLGEGIRNFKAGLKGDEETPPRQLPSEVNPPDSRT